MQLDDELASAEEFIQEYGVPVCDYKLALEEGYTKAQNLVSQFKDSVRRSMVLNLYNTKKSGKLMQLIRELKKKNEEEEKRKEKERRRERFKKDLANIINGKVKGSQNKSVNLPERNHDSTDYTDKIFTYMGLKLDNYNQSLDVQINDLEKIDFAISKLREELI